MGGIEATGVVLYPGVWLKDRVKSVWHDYVALSDAAKENIRLHEELSNASVRQHALNEEIQELARLREFLDIPATRPWEQTGARVVAAKFGPQAALNSIMINKGFLGGAISGAPVVVKHGIVGRVFRSAPHSATVLLMTDPSFRVSVIGQESRVRGILSGVGGNQPLELLYVAPNTSMKPGEVLVCSGIDGIAPKGVPAARVQTVRYDNDLLFPVITAVPMVDLDKIEEVVVLIPPKGEKAEDLLYPLFDESALHGGSMDGVTDEEAARGMGN